MRNGGWTLCRAVACGVVLALPVCAHATDPAVEAAARANEVNQTYCGDAYSRDISLAADSTMRVADAWREVSEIYEETEVPYLLFWRGVLAQCLGRPGNAYDDLDSFVESQETTRAYADLVRQAKVRLRRLGRKKDLGDGPIASYLQSNQVFEGTVGYRGGMIVQGQACTDSPESGNDRYLNVACLAGDPPVWRWGLMGQPAGLKLALAGYPLPFLGIGGRFEADLPLASDLGVDEGWLDPTQVGPLWTLLVGPVLRLQKPMSTGARGLRLQIMPGFHARHERISPLAGALNMLEKVGLVGVGTYGWTLPGGALWMELSLEVSRSVALRLGGGGGITGSRIDPSLPVVAEPSAEIVNMPSITSIGATGHARGHLGLLWALDQGNLAFAPTLAFSWHTSGIGFPVPTGDEFHGDEDRKVYSTRQDLYCITLELALRFGVGR